MILLGHPYLAEATHANLELTSLARHVAATIRGIGYWGPGDGFPDPTQFVDHGWDPAERAMVLAYLRSVPRDPHWQFLGYSWCRFQCGIRPEALGTGEQTDDAFTWPIGFVHYIESHGVRPPGEFIEHVRERVHHDRLEPPP